MKKFLLYTLFFLSGLCGFAQTIDINACFTLNKVRVCVGEKVIATNCIDTKGTNTPKQGFFNFGDSDVDTSKHGIGIERFADTSHVYNKPGTYRIKEWGGTKSGFPDEMVKYITVLPAQLPQFNVGLCEGFKVSVDITDNFYSQYSFIPDNGLVAQTITSTIPFTYSYADALQKTASIQGECGAAVTKQFIPISNLIKPDVFSLEITKNGIAELASITFNAIANMRYKVLEANGAANFIPIDTIEGISGPSIKSYPLTTGDKCFALASFDDCGNADTSYSLCSNTLTVTASNNQNLLTWTSPYPVGVVDNYQVFRDGQLLAPLSSSTYADTDILCGKTYTYRITANLIYKNNFDNSPLQSITAPAAATAISKRKPGAVTGLNATVTGSNVELVWNKPLSGVKSYTILRAGELKDFTDYGSGVANKFSDNQTDVQNQHYCYKVSYIDSCNNVANDSLITCTVLLKTAKDAEEKNNSNWTKYVNGNQNGFTYFLQKLDDSDQLISEQNSATDTTYTDPASSPDILLTRYRVRVLENGVNGFTGYSNIFTVKNDLMLFVPNVFTPNNDGTNDILLAYGKYFKDFKMSIYNRWGELVFYSEDINSGWDGIYKGVPANPDNYVFVVNLKNNKGETVTRKGDFILLK